MTYFQGPYLEYMLLNWSSGLEYHALTSLVFAVWYQPFFEMFLFSAAVIYFNFGIILLQSSQISQISVIRREHIQFVV